MAKKTLRKKRKKSPTLGADEQALLESVERGEWTTRQDQIEATLRRITDYIQALIGVMTEMTGAMRDIDLKLETHTTQIHDILRVRIPDESLDARITRLSREAEEAAMKEWSGPPTVRAEVEKALRQFCEESVHETVQAVHDAIGKLDDQD